MKQNIKTIWYKMTAVMIAVVFLCQSAEVFALAARSFCQEIEEGMAGDAKSVISIIEKMAPGEGRLPEQYIAQIHQIVRNCHDKNTLFNELLRQIEMIACWNYDVASVNFVMAISYFFSEEYLRSNSITLPKEQVDKLLLIHDAWGVWEGRPDFQKVFNCSGENDITSDSPLMNLFPAIFREILCGNSITVTGYRDTGEKREAIQKSIDKWVENKALSKYQSIHLANFIAVLPKESIDNVFRKVRECEVGDPQRYKYLREELIIPFCCKNNYARKIFIESERGKSNFREYSKKTYPSLSRDIAWNCLFGDRRKASKFLQFATMTRQVCPYTISKDDPRPPLQYAREEGLVFEIFPGSGLFMTPVTQSFRRHLIFATENGKPDGKVKFAFEVKIPGNRSEVRGKEHVYADDSWEIAERIRGTDPNYCVKPIYKIGKEENWAGVFNLYGEEVSYEEGQPLEIIAFNYMTEEKNPRPEDGKRLDFITPEMVRQLAIDLKVPQKELEDNIVSQIADLLASVHCQSYIGNNSAGTDMHTGNFRLIVDKNAETPVDKVRIKYVGDFPAFEQADGDQFAWGMKDDYVCMVDGSRGGGEPGLRSILKNVEGMEGIFISHRISMYHRLYGNLGVSEGFIKSKTGQVADKEFNEQKEKIRRSGNVTNEYKEKLLNTLNTALVKVLRSSGIADKTKIIEALSAQIKKIQSGNFKIYGYEGIVKDEEDYHLGECGDDELFLALDMLAEFMAQGPESLVDEYLLHEILCPLLGHDEAIKLQRIIYPEHYTDEYLAIHEKGGLLGKRIRDYINKKSSGAIVKTYDRNIQKPMELSEKVTIEHTGHIVIGDAKDRIIEVYDRYGNCVEKYEYLNDVVKVMLANVKKSVVVREVCLEYRYSEDYKCEVDVFINSRKVGILSIGFRGSTARIDYFYPLGIPILSGCEVAQQYQGNGVSETILNWIARFSLREGIGGMSIETPTISVIMAASKCISKMRINGQLCSRRMFVENLYRGHYGDRISFLLEDGKSVGIIRFDALRKVWFYPALGKRVSIRKGGVFLGGKKIGKVYQIVKKDVSLSGKFIFKYPTIEPEDAGVPVGRRTWVGRGEWTRQSTWRGLRDVGRGA